MLSVLPLKAPFCCVRELEHSLAREGKQKESPLPLWERVRVRGEFLTYLLSLRLNGLREDEDEEGFAVSHGASGDWDESLFVAG
jgi:hypothetical protein